MEDAGLDGTGSEGVRSRFQHLRESKGGWRSWRAPDPMTPPWQREGDPIPAFLNEYVCLCVDEGCVRSVLGDEESSQQSQALPDPKATSTATAREQSGEYLLVVDADYNPGGEYVTRDFRGVLKVGARTVFVELAPMLINQRIYLDQLYGQSKMECSARNGTWSP